MTNRITMIATVMNAIATAIATMIVNMTMIVIKNKKALGLP
jgi:hypothetical protein